MLIFSFSPELSHDAADCCQHILSCLGSELEGDFTYAHVNIVELHGCPLQQGEHLISGLCTVVTAKG